MRRWRCWVRLVHDYPEAKRPLDAARQLRESLSREDREKKIRESLQEIEAKLSTQDWQAALNLIAGRSIPVPRRGAV